ncbi:MAG: glycosyltransferase [Nitrospirae bacterium]|nr:glycosyltransferase [Magnetococcales bacterium]HAT50691.1 hypothetical protein [Alphaproteobacteria bacterium]
MIPISVVIICLNEAANIGACLHSLTCQDYPVEQVEIIVVDGGSQDGTLEEVASFQRRWPHVRVEIEPRRGAAIGRNTGLWAARNPYVAFIDADCQAPEGWLQRLAERFVHHTRNDSQVVAVGGGNIPPDGDHPLEEAIAIALDSFVGSFNSPQGRAWDHEREVVSLPTLNVLYDKKRVLEVGGFDITLQSDAEDADLNYRLRLKGERLIFIPNLAVRHHFRPTLTTWYRNMFRYGRGRARLLKRHRGMWSWIYLLPPLFVLGFASMVLAPWWPFFWLPLLYFPCIVIYSGILCAKRKRLDRWARVAAIFVIQHFGYGYGQVYGLLNPSVR